MNPYVHLNSQQTARSISMSFSADCTWCPHVQISSRQWTLLLISHCLSDTGHFTGHHLRYLMLFIRHRSFWCSSPQTSAAILPSGVDLVSSYWASSCSSEQTSLVPAHHTSWTWSWIFTVCAINCRLAAPCGINVDLSVGDFKCIVGFPLASQRREKWHARTRIGKQASLINNINSGELCILMINMSLDGWWVACCSQAPVAMTLISSHLQLHIYTELTLPTLVGSSYRDEN
jgi:hypothetical protein